MRFFQKFLATVRPVRTVPVNIAFINASTRVSDKEAQGVMGALQTQVDRDFAPIWGIGANLTFVPKGQKPPAGMWWLVILDNSDTAGALGYHDLTSDSNLPLGKIFAATDAQYHLAWSVTASHELLEMLVDPYCNLTVFEQPTNTTGSLYAYEVCDACEDDQYAYVIGSFKVSDFVTPAWFESFRAPGSTKFDFMGHIDRPYKLLPGGYIGKFDVTAGRGWTQVTAESHQHKYSDRPAVGSRRERRNVGHRRWMISSAHK